MTADLVKSASAIQEAINLLATNGAYRRALSVHHVGNGARCASCGQHFPCSLARWATAAQTQVARKAARAARKADAALLALSAPESTTATPQVVSAPTGGVS